MAEIITNAEDKGFLDFVANIRGKMRKHEFLMIYEGTFSQSLTRAVLALTEKKMEQDGEDRKIKRKVFNVMVECLQNISKHGDSAIDMNQSIFLIGQNKEGYIISTGNAIEIEEIGALENKLLAINNMEQDELKDLYRSLMAHGEYSDKSGAGLGLIDIARKSGEELEFQFFDLDENTKFFALSTKIIKK